MWLFTDNGFVSAVRKDDSGDIVVRSRDIASLEELSNYANADIVDSEGSDYPYRVVVADSVWAEYVSRKALDIDYPNFKDRVYKSRGKKFAKLLGEVWATMYEADDRELELPYANDDSRWFLARGK